MYALLNAGSLYKLCFLFIYKNINFIGIFLLILFLLFFFSICFSTLVNISQSVLLLVLLQKFLVSKISQGKKKLSVTSVLPFSDVTENVSFGKLLNF